MTDEAQPELVATKTLEPDDDGPKGLYFGVMLKFWSDGTVTWESTD